MSELLREILYNPPGVVWPILVVICLLLWLRAIGDEVKPIFKAMTATIAQNASKYAMSWAIAMAFGFSASLAAVYDVFKDMDQASWVALSWPQIVALVSKVLNPFVVASLAYAVQGGSKSSPPKEPTAPPFPSP